MDDKIQKVIENIKGCSFDSDRDENATKSRNLLEAKVNIQTKLFDLDADYQKARNECLMNEDIQKGKNAEVRNAMIELELVGKFGNRDEYKFILNVMNGVEKHNANIISMFFNGKGE